MTREEKEKEVIELYKQGVNTRKIAKRVHMSFGDIGRITRKFSGDDILEGLKKHSPHSQALELFQRGYSLLEVAKKLDLTYSQTIEEYNQYMRLIGSDKFVEFYIERQGDLASYVSIGQQLKMAGINVTDAIEGVRLAGQLGQMKIEYNGLWTEKQRLITEIDSLSNQVIVLIQEKNSITKEVETLKEVRYVIRNEVPMLSDNNEMPPTMKTPKKRHRRKWSSVAQFPSQSVSPK